MQRDGNRDSRFRTTLLLLILAAAVCIPGCKGCSCRSNPNSAKTPEELEKELEERAARLREQEKKKPLRQLRYTSLPHGPMGGFPKLGENPQEACFLKPGHWTTTTFSAVANNYDISGNLEIAAGETTPLPGMPFAVDTQRSVAFPKGQARTVNSILFLPEGKAVPLHWTLDARRKTGGYFSFVPAVRRMPVYQFHFLVLARYPELYGYVKTLDAVGSKASEHYRVSLMTPGRRTPIPDQSLFWTSTAYVLWDDADPDALSLDQQVALLDWLHWGGQLIISGPETLETLNNSFLSEYLPAKGEGTVQLTKSDLEEINQYWTLPIRGLPTPPLTPISQWSGVKLNKHPDAQYVPTTGDLVVERRIGRGRVVVTAFKLSGREIVSWPGLDGFYNGCLMRRPPRRYGGTPLTGDLADYSVHWAEGSKGGSQYSTEWLTQLRYFSRDAGRRAITTTVDTLALGDDPEFVSGLDPTLSTEGLKCVPVMNYGAWNDFNAVADGARAALSEAAGIEVPDRSFVVWIVAGYLVVLVPVNWLIFKLLGRVEWAWIAAPVIAVICAIVVIRQAQLDIGFVRSETEVAIVELQADYPRAHVTRYSAFYTSLGTGYDFEFEDPGAQILPFPTQGDPEVTGLKLAESPQRVTYRYGSEARLEDLRVRSSSAQMTHSEQMLDMGGGLRWLTPSPGVFRVENRTGYQIHDAGVIRKTAEGKTVAAWLGSMEPEEAADVGRWEPVVENETSESPWIERRDRVPETGRGIEAGTLTVRPLLGLAEQATQMQPGDVRLVGWTDEPLPGMEVRPRAPQKRRVALLIANLRYGFGEVPRPDKNTRYDFTRSMPVFRDDGSGSRDESESDENASEAPQ